MKAVFIVGTGRSGTHFLTRLLRGFASIHDPLGGREEPDILRRTAKAALHHRPLGRRVTGWYRHRLAAAEGRVFLNQHHPNLFFTDELLALEPDSVFLFPERPTYQIVASMLRHKGVMGWYDYAARRRRALLGRLPYPNAFLGLDHAGLLDELPPHLLCARRVVAHKARFARLAARGDGRVRGIGYEALVADPPAEFARVLSTGEHAALGRFEPVETPDPGSLTKYRDTLTDAQVAEIIEDEARATPAPADP